MNQSPKKLIKYFFSHTLFRRQRKKLYKSKFIFQRFVMLKPYSLFGMVATFEVEFHLFHHSEKSVPLNFKL